MWSIVWIQKPSNHFLQTFRWLRMFKIVLRVGLSDEFCKNTGHFDLSTASDLNRVVFHKRRRENTETISILLGHN